MAKQIINIHGHSHGSLLDGMTRPNELVDYTLEMGQPASCITDHGVLYSIVDHFQYAKSKGQKAIAGFEAYVVKDHKVKDKTEAQSETENKREHLVLLAKDNDGYKRLMKICSTGCTDGFYYRPRIDDKVLTDIGTEGLIATSACLAGRIAQRLLRDDIKGAEEWAIHYYKMFHGDFYLEIQPTIDPEQVKINLGIIEIHKRTGIPIVATSDYHYLKREDSDTHDALLCMQSRSLIDDPNRWRFPGDTFFVMTREQMTQLFKQNGHEILDQNVIELAMDTTLEIGNKCNVNFDWNTHYLPSIDIPNDNHEFTRWSTNRKSDGSVSADYMRYLAIKGLKKKGLTSQSYRDRLEFELKTIIDMGFPDYFLVMEDIMRFCRDNDIPVGPARGSGGGSLVAYALGITKVDPLQYDLLFERFLNPDRGHLPDIDSDFCVEKGWMVFDYLIKKYGKERCCNIITFGRLQVKAIIKDLAKAMGIPYEEVNELTKTISDDVKHIDDLKELPEFILLFEKYPKLYDHARKLEGSPRHASQHPAGICVMPINVTDVLPVQNAKETQEGVEPGYLSQFEKEQVELVGGVKIDVLKLKNVTEIRWQLNEINRRYGLNLTEEDIPFDDQKTWDLISRGDTLGVFQFASNVALPVIRKMKPQNIEELAAANSFIRPGTSGLDEYIVGKENNSRIRKLDPRLDRHLASTYGAIVFQEQIMFLISELMGISFGQADLYRRALEKPAKDKKGYVKNFNENAVEIASKYGFSPEVTDLVRQLIIDNSGYAFNKSHAVAYSIISYWTAWLKANYPLVFYTMMFNGNLDSLPEFIAEARKQGITVLPPHVSYSKYGSTIEDENNKIIRMGFNSVKGVGPAAVDSICKNQPYTSMDDFFERNELRSVNKRVIEALIKVDGFKDLGVNIEETDMPNNIKQLYDIYSVNNKIYVKLNRNQMAFWYNEVIVASTKKAVPNYAVPISMIKGKYLDIYDLAVEDNTIIIPETKLEDFELKLDNVLSYKTRKRPKGFLKLTDDSMKKVTPFRIPFVLSGFEMSKIKEDYLETYLKEIEDLGFSFLNHPLENHMDKIMSYDSVEDGYMLITAGIIIELIPRTTKNNKKMYWVILQTPREKVRITMWDNQYKQYSNVVKKYNMLVVKGTKGYGSISIETLKEIKFKA